MRHCVVPERHRRARPSCARHGTRVDGACVPSGGRRRTRRLVARRRHDDQLNPHTSRHDRARARRRGLRELDDCVQANRALPPVEFEVGRWASG